ncbi:MAG: methionyl-tRNA formyltransferase [Burkholderiaceae bacterium]
MRVVFAGTPEFAQIALAALHRAGFEIALVLTQPDRPAGRGLKLHASPVRTFALDQGLAVAQPRSLRLDGKYPLDAAQARVAIETARADVMVVAAYGLILPAWVLELPRLGCLNIHASLLPRWRGAAPIHRAIEAGDAQTGVTIMQMDAGLDTGDMLLVEAIPIAPDDTAASLHDRLALLGARLIIEALGLAERGGLRRTVQPEQGVSYAHKIGKAEAAIDWGESAAQIERRIRAFDPFPGASGVLQGEKIKCWRAVVTTGVGAPGEVLAVADDGIAVACGVGALRLTTLQRAGGKRLAAHQFLQGRSIAVGAVFEPVAR